MINLEEVLLKLVAELSTSDFEKAIDKAGFGTLEKRIILDALHARGV